MFSKEPEISVGILAAPSLRFTLHGDFIDSHTGGLVSGEQEIGIKAYFGKRLFVPASEESFFELHRVVIGKAFHWEREETQRFRGTLKIIRDDEQLIAVNVIGIEEYLRSVISSEMSAGSPAESLKAHAVISRSWLLSQVLNKEKKAFRPGFVQTDSEYIRWYDREEHEQFDVCADDHCQRYQGITRISSPEVDAAIAETRGKVLMYRGEICDARYSKCCGGMTETFQNVWEPTDHPYLKPVRDLAVPPIYASDLTLEEKARPWIETTPPAFCNTTDKALLSTVLNNYDQETPDFYRWRVEYTQTELSELVKKRLGIDFGTIEALHPVQRGASGRLIKLKIVGTKRTLTIGKELVIRRALSESHLYSSAFVVDTTEKEGEKIFVLTGAGWGHGVGLCQIGAAVMGAQGYAHPAILHHYYPGAELKNLY
ncbi:SpoIID/LytB domain-containing protein [Alistipes sp. OttesenSCG-928-L06]|nr:SpoIID/LytB domain-containing protein [Alistipes sp. OttesenSCG-928-L06]